MGSCEISTIRLGENQEQESRGIATNTGNPTNVMVKGQQLRPYLRPPGLLR
jgi:hypothetical protein